MGTRSATFFIDGNRTVCHLYRQFDGNPEYHGLELAHVCDVILVNGIRAVTGGATYANGIGCLAASVVAKLKTDIGGFYLHGPDELANDWCEYIYVVRSQGLGKSPIIGCSTQAGPWPFNLQATDGHVFTGTPGDWHVFTGTPGDWLARFGSAANDNEAG